VGPVEEKRQVEDDGCTGPHGLFPYGIGCGAGGREETGRR
jgi:hypothetical protein